jgi:hypothetical protein
MKPRLDVDTLICGYRELLSTMRTFCAPALAAPQSRLYTSIMARPYLRVLAGLGAAAREAGWIELATSAYEELLRLDRADNSEARTPSSCATCGLLAGRSWRVRRLPFALWPIFKLSLPVSGTTAPFSDRSPISNR